MNPAATSTARNKKVYHLRKTVSSAVRKERAQDQKRQQSNQQNNNVQFNTNRNQYQDNSIMGLNNNSFLKKNQQNNNTISENNIYLDQLTTRRQVQGPDLNVNILFLDFNQRLNFIQNKEIKVKNIGSSAIYYQWRFKNQPKIAQYAIKDSKPKFFCHYSKNSIKPGEQITFVFSFVSEIPGYFTQQCDLITQPALLTPVPTIKLQGKAFIDDQWKDQRANFLKQLQDSARFCSVTETVDDIVDNVKLPEPEKPNVKDLKIAQQIFEKVNQNLGLYFNAYIHNWFNQLYQQIWLKQNPQNQVDLYWDQSIMTFKKFIASCKKIDEIEKKCYLQRLQHYTYLSTFSLPQKNMLYDTVHKFIADTAYHIGGQYLDTVRKQLDMWQVQFREPLDTDGQQQIKARKQEVEKIKAQWLKRTKKKKWGEEQDRQMIEDYKGKLKSKANHQLLTDFQGFEDSAEFTKIKKSLQLVQFNSDKYFLFLQRLKNVKEYHLEGKKVLLKFNLKLKDNCENQLKELQEYLIKKQQQKRKAQQEKKNQDNKKKKVPKKKGQKQQQQQKPLSFDFMSLLDQQNWNGFLQTFKTVQQKSPYLILIGCTYRQRIGRKKQNLSVKFLLQLLKNIQPSIQFMEHSQLLQIKQQIQNQIISQGSIFLVENLNFLSSQTLTCQELQIYEQDGIQKQKITKRNVIYPEIRSNLDLWVSSLQVIIDQDRFLTKPSGISSYSNIDVVLGNSWWNYIGLMCRIKQQYVILGGDFNPESYLLLNRLLGYTKKIYLTGKIAFKFSLIANNVKSKKFVNFTMSPVEQNLIKEVIQNNLPQKLYIPRSFRFSKINTQNGNLKQIINKSLIENEEDLSQLQVIDIVEQISDELLNSQFSGHLYMLGKAHLCEYVPNEIQMKSTNSILKTIYKLQQQKRTRHSIQINTPAGIGYEKDIVFYLIGIQQSYVEQIQLKDKKINLKIKNSEQDEQQDQQVQEPEQEQGQGEKKKIDLIADFKLGCQKTVKKLLSGKFDYGLKNISKYPKPIEI